MMQVANYPHGLVLVTGSTGSGKSTIARAEQRGLFTWRREVFRWMQRNAPSAVEYFRLPPDRVVELGTQLRL